MSNRRTTTYLGGKDLLRQVSEYHHQPVTKHNKSSKQENLLFSLENLVVEAASGLSDLLAKAKANSNVVVSQRK